MCSIYLFTNPITLTISKIIKNSLFSLSEVLGIAQETIRSGIVIFCDRHRKNHMGICSIYLFTNPITLTISKIIKNSIFLLSEVLRMAQETTRSRIVIFCDRHRKIIWECALFVFSPNLSL